MKRKKKLELRDFQKEDVAFMKANNYRVLVANGQGTGKTIECLAALSIDRKMLCPAIIVCPASVVYNWKIEARKWCKWARIHVVAGKKQALPQRRHHIYIISWSLLAERSAELMGVRPKLLVADEAHFAKNEESRRSQALQHMSAKIPHLLLLSGTPLINSKSELDTLNRLLGSPNPPMIRRLLKDVAPDVPEKHRMILPVYLRPRHASEYKKAFEQFDIWLRQELAKRMSKGEAAELAQRALAAEALVKIGYLRRLVGIAKTYAAVDFISRAVRVGEPLVVFAEHKDVISRIQLMLKKQNITYVTVRGSTPKTIRQKAVKRFQRGETSVFIGTKAAHTGITLTRARHLVFVERFWTSADEEQAEDRIRRISQTYPTKIWFLHATGTVDDRIADIITRKRKIIKKAIGSEEVKEKDEDIATEIIAKWSEDVSAPTHNGDPMLGLVKSLPPLPKKHLVQSVTFHGKRWNEPSVRAWCRMNKYRINKIRRFRNKFEAIMKKPSNFVPHSLKITSVSKQIKILAGQPLSKRKVGQKIKPHNRLTSIQQHMQQYRQLSR